MFDVPKSMLVDVIDYHEYLGVDRSHIPTYDDKRTVEYVRIDRSAVYTRDSGESRKRADATIYCFRAHTTPFESFKTQSKVRFDGTDYTITDVRAFTEPFSNVITAYELEVIR